MRTKHPIENRVICLAWITLIGIFMVSLHLRITRSELLKRIEKLEQAATLSPGKSK